MQTSILTNFVLAIVLPSLRISPLLLIRIATIALLYAAALSFNVVYIQSIGSGIGIFSGLFHETLISQSIETFFHIVGALILMPWSLINSVNLCLEHLCPTEELVGLLLSSLLPIISKRLTKVERENMTLSAELKEILVGLLLGAISGQKQATNVRFKFEQGIVHKDYLLHLFELFSCYCSNTPKIHQRAPDKKTGKVHSSISLFDLFIRVF
jgi:NADH-ubiquinone oxidoreductase chain 2